MQCYQSVPLFPTDTSLAFGHGIFYQDYPPFDSCCDFEPMQIIMSSQCGSSEEESGDETQGRILTNPSILDSQSEAEKLQIRQLKAARRKERNKEAARKSNQAKKTFRDNLQKKSVELLEQKLQLEQDIKDLRNQLNHYALLYNHITHVCDYPQHGGAPERRL